jgi:molybdopterin synthase catalytic subunit
MAHATNAFLPKVSVQREDFDLQGEVKELSAGRHDIGAVVTFSGLCRDEGGRLEALELEHYPGMAKAQIIKIAGLAIERFQLNGLTTIHRYGKILPGENIVLVVTAASHRQAAFDAANFMMDYLKTSAPFWKKEHGRNGKAGDWVSARDADDAAQAKWTEER